MNLDELADYIRQSGQRILIEAEAKRTPMQRFITRHNATHFQSVTVDTVGIIILHDGADKWGVELRVYFEHTNGMPAEFARKARVNNTYKDQYQYRINDHEVVEELFARGFHIGLN